MARVFITGSSDGLGRLAARWLVGQKHEVVLHARDEQRAREARAGVPGAADVLVGNLADLGEVKALAAAVNASGRFDAVIHNAGVYRAAGRELLAVNVLAPYVLTCLVQPPHRLIYLSSGMHQQGNPSLAEMTAGGSRLSYSDSKLLVLLLANSVARRWPDVAVNSVDPGWVPTKMGGRDAPDDLQKGWETQAWLAVSDEDDAKASGRYLHHRKVVPHHRAVDDIALQDELLATCARITGVELPRS